MAHILPFESPAKSPSEGGRDRMWAVIATIGRTRQVASLYPTRAAALADCEWRQEQVRAYARFLRLARDPVPLYHIAPMHRAELPKGWKPLPALGLLQGRFT